MQLRQGSCLICLGQSGGLVNSNFPPEILHDISLQSNNSQVQLVAELGPVQPQLVYPRLSGR